MTSRSKIEYECCDGYRATSYSDMIVHIIKLEQFGVFDVYPDLAREQAKERAEYVSAHSVSGRV